MNKLEAYKVCKERGHDPENYLLTSNPPISKCKFCGVSYRYESVIIELGVPKDD